jgi:pyruvate,water dikinase
MTLGVDRDSGKLSGNFNESDPSVKFLIQRAVASARAAGKYCGICGQAPSDDPSFAEWLVSIGMPSVSLQADSLLTTSARIVEAEGRLQEE